MFIRPLNWQEMFIADVKRAIKICGSRAELCRKLNLNYGTVSDWLRGATPKESTIRIVYEFLDSSETRTKG